MHMFAHTLQTVCVCVCVCVCAEACERVSQGLSVFISLPLHSAFNKSGILVWRWCFPLYEGRRM